MFSFELPVYLFLFSVFRVFILLLQRCFFLFFCFWGLLFLLSLFCLSCIFFMCFDLGSVDTTPEKFENAALFLWLGLLSTLIRHENAALRKRSSNWRNLKRPAFRFCVEGKHFENGAFRKQCTMDIVTVIMWFRNSSGVMWTKKIWPVFRVKPPFSDSSSVVWPGPHIWWISWWS